MYTFGGMVVVDTGCPMSSPLTLRSAKCGPLGPCIVCNGGLRDLMLCCWYTQHEKAFVTLISWYWSSSLIGWGAKGFVLHKLRVTCCRSEMDLYFVHTSASLSILLRVSNSSLLPQRHR